MFELAYAKSNSGTKHVFLGAGALAHQFEKVTKDRSGSVDKVGVTYTIVGLSGRLSLGKGFYFNPAGSYTILGRKSQDDATSVSLLTTTLFFTKNILFLDFKAGPGVLFQIMSGKSMGGVVRSNGNTNSTFMRPSYSSVSRVLTINAGIGVLFGKYVRMDLDGILAGATSLRRTYSGLAQVSFGFL